MLNPQIPAPTLTPDDLRRLLQHRASVLKAPAEVVASCNPYWPGRHVSLDDMLPPAYAHGLKPPSLPGDSDGQGDDDGDNLTHGVGRATFGLVGLVGRADLGRVSVTRGMRKRLLRRAAAQEVREDRLALRASLRALNRRATVQELEAARALLEHLDSRSVAMQRAFARFTREDLLPQAVAILEQADAIEDFCVLAAPQDVSKLLNYCLDPSTFDGHRARRRGGERLLKNTRSGPQLDDARRLLRHGASLQTPDALGQVPMQALNDLRDAVFTSPSRLAQAEGLLSLPLDWDAHFAQRGLPVALYEGLARQAAPVQRFPRLASTLAAALHQHAAEPWFVFPPAGALWDAPDAAGTRLFDKVAPRLQAALQAEDWNALARLRRSDYGGREQPLVQDKLVQLIIERNWDACVRLQESGWCEQLDTHTHQGLAAQTIWRRAWWHTMELRDLEAAHRLDALEPLIEGGSAHTSEDGSAHRG